MADLAELNLLIHSQSAKEAYTDLEQLDAVSERVENQTRRTSEATSFLDKITLGYARTIREVLGPLASLIAAYKALDAVKTALIRSVMAAAEFEALKQGYSTILGSMEKAKALLGDIESLALKTPFDFAGLANVSKMLLAMGIDAKDVVRTMRVMGDTVSALGGNGQKLETLALAIGQIQTKGKLSGGELRQLAEAGIPAIDIISKGFGIDVPEAMKRSEQGMISAKDALRILMDGLDARFGGAAESISGKVLGLTSNLQEAFQVASRQVGEILTLVFGVSAALKTAILVVDRVAGVVNGLLSELSGIHVEGLRVSPVLKQIAEAIREITIAIAAFTAVQAVPLIVNLTGRAAALAATLVSLTTAVRVLALVLGTTPLGVVARLAAVAAVGMYQYKDSVVSAGKEQVTFGNYVSAAWSLIVDNVKFAGGELIDYILNMWTIIWDGVKYYTAMVSKEISKSMDGIGLDIPKAFDEALSVIKSWANTVYGILRAVGETASVIIARIFSSMYALTEIDMTGGWSKFTQSVKLAKGVLGDTFDASAMKRDVEEVWKEALSTDHLGEFLNFGTEAGGSLLEGLRESLFGKMSWTDVFKEAGFDTENIGGMGLFSGENWTKFTGDLRKRAETAALSSRPKPIEPPPGTPGMDGPGAKGNNSPASEGLTEQQQDLVIKVAQARTEGFLNATPSAVRGFEAQVGEFRSQAVKAFSVDAPNNYGPRDDSKAIEVTRQYAVELQTGKYNETVVAAKELNEQATLQASLVGQSNVQKDIGVAMTKAESSAIGLTTDQRKHLIELAVEYADTLQEISYGEELENLKKTSDELDLQINLLGKTAVEQDKIIALQKAETAAIGLTIDQRQKLLDAAGAYGDKLEELARKSKNLEILERTANQIGRSFEDAFADGILGAKSFGAAMKELAKEIQETLLRNLVLQPLIGGITSAVTGGISGAFPGVFGGGPQTVPTLAAPSFAAPVLASAKGNVFDGGQLLHFAKGGSFDRGSVVSTPTYFPVNGNRTGIMGEAGPEAIVPLKRDRDGRLGVQMVTPTDSMNVLREDNLRPGVNAATTINNGSTATDLELDGVLQVLQSIDSKMDEISSRVLEVARAVEILGTIQAIASVSTAISAGNLKGMLSGPAFANGGAFSGGRVIPFADGGIISQGRSVDLSVLGPMAAIADKVSAFAVGGIVSKPTYFPMAGGMTGLMGEAGDEAILPLKRGSNGRLGVELNNDRLGLPQRPEQASAAFLVPTGDGAERDRGAEKPTNVQQTTIHNWNIKTQDADSFRRSKSQVGQAANSIVRNAR